MRFIIPDITNLPDYFFNFDDIMDQYHNDCKPCPHCGAHSLWKHGFYERKPDRETGEYNFTLHQRYICRYCHKTCSVLPECIPPRRWYIWKIQQSALSQYLSGISIKSIAKSILPSRSTVSRWIDELKEKFLVYADTLKSLVPSLGYYSNFNSFWQGCLDQWSLSSIMLTLNNHGLDVP